MSSGPPLPKRSIYLVANIAGVRDLKRRSCRRDEAEGVARTLTSAMVCSIFGMWQATHSLPRAARLVMRVLLDGRGMRAVRRVRPVAVEAHDAGRLAAVRIVGGAVDVVAGEAGDAARVHQALHEIVALHAVLVRGAVGEMGEGGLAELVLFQLPEIAAGRRPTWKPTGQS